MIVQMKKVTLLTLRQEQEHALNDLRDLGVMQITLDETFSNDSNVLKEELFRLTRCVSALRQFAADEKISVKDHPGNIDSGHRAAERFEALAEKKSVLLAEQSDLAHRLEELAVWGDFDSSLIEKLRQDGVNVLLCLGTPDDFIRASAAENDGCFEICRRKGQVAFAVVFTTALDASEYPVMRMAPDEDPRRIAAKLQDIDSELDSIRKEMISLLDSCGAIDAAIDEISGRFEFSRVRDSLAEHGEIAVLGGYVPTPEIEKLSAQAAEKGWGLLILDPDEDDDVPVLIHNNRFTRMIKPLFDFLGIVPGYREIDISGGVLIFFTIFYAIIIGDAGYGILFGAVAVAGLAASRKVPALKPPMRLLLVLSAAATVWGALCGSWFGLSQIGSWQIPALECFRDFSSNSAKQANIQFFCFILAVIQLSVGRMWRVFAERNWRAAGQHIGWMLIIWGNFFLTLRLIVYPGEFPKFMYVLYGIGLLLVMLCGVNWKQAADIFQFPFDIIGSFTDVLSYIRLFAVGLAGACIAGSFNGMAFDLCKVSAWLIPAGVIVVLIGHALNIALALLSVLVHAVRLNTLEFSNHTGLSWSGQNFNPFKSHKKEDN